MSPVHYAIDGCRSAGIHEAMGKRILCIEDDPDWRRLMTMALKDAGYEVLAVPGAAEALLQKDDAGVNVIVLDLDLGGENGLMLLRHLKRHHPSAPIILHTGIEHEDAAILRMLEHGAQRYVRKGTIDNLLRAVEAALIGQS